MTHGPELSRPRLSVVAVSRSFRASELAVCTHHHAGCQFFAIPPKSSFEPPVPPTNHHDRPEFTNPPQPIPLCRADTDFEHISRNRILKIIQHG